MKTADAIAAL